MKRSAPVHLSQQADPYSFAQLVSGTVPVSEVFFTQSTLPLARALLGCVLVNGETAGMIVETEAYVGSDDRAAHSFRGRTKRTEVIFGPPGHAYVYFIYGMHECLNIVAEAEGVAGCVLLRALEPLSGLRLMRERRHWSGPAFGLANGPGKLTEALAITRALYGTSLVDGPMTLRHWHRPPSFRVAATGRIGIRECAEWPYRFIWEGHPCLSRRVLPSTPIS